MTGIFQMLMSFPEFLKSNPSAEKVIKNAVDYFLTLEDADGNYPPAMDEVGCQRPDGEELIQWCHGAPGKGMIVQLNLYIKATQGNQKM